MVPELFYNKNMAVVLFYNNSMVVVVLFYNRAPSLLILISTGRRLTCENWGPAKQTKHLLIFVFFQISSLLSFCGTTILCANELGLI